MNCLRFKSFSSALLSANTSVEVEFSEDDQHYLQTAYFLANKAKIDEPIKLLSN